MLLDWSGFYVARIVLNRRTDGYIILDADGVPCGKGWISRKKKCSRDKRLNAKRLKEIKSGTASTPGTLEEYKQLNRLRKTVQNTRERHNARVVRERNKERGLDKPFVPQGIGAKNTFTQYWAKAWPGDTPKDLQAAINAVPPPTEEAYRLAANPGNSAFARPWMGVISMSDYKSSKGAGSRDNGVYRHEYGHHLDYQLARIARKEPEAKRKKLESELDQLRKSHLDERVAAVKKTGADKLKSDRLIKRTKKAIEAKEKELSAVRAGDYAHISSSPKMMAEIDADGIELIQKVAKAKKKDAAADNRLIKMSAKELGQLGIDPSEAVALEVAKRMGDEAARSYLDSIRDSLVGLGYDDARVALSTGASLPIGSSLSADSLQAYADKHLPARLRPIYEQVPTGSTPGDLYGKREALIRLLRYNESGDPKLLLGSSGIEDAFLATDGGSVFGLISDLTGSMTLNKVGMGHSDGYYRQSEHLSYTETFANMTALYSSGPGGQALLEEFAPNALKEYKNALKLVQPTTPPKARRKK